MSVDFGGLPAPLVGEAPGYAGLTPTAAGLYQLNAAVPSGAAASTYFDVSTPEAYRVSEATINVQGANSSVAQPSARVATSLRPLRKRAVTEPRP